MDRPLANASALHQRAIVIDGHSDILMPIADGKIRLKDRASVPDPASWQPPPELARVSGSLASLSPHSHFFGPTGHYSLPQWREGGITVQVCAIYLSDHELSQALQRALRMTWWLHREVEENDDLELITRVADIARVKQAGHVGAILAFEGLEPLGAEPEFLDLFYKLGLRMAGLSHSRRNYFADGMQAGTHTGGLTPAGKDIVRRMNELGIVIRHRRGASQPGRVLGHIGAQQPAGGAQPQQLAQLLSQGGRTPAALSSG